MPTSSYMGDSPGSKVVVIEIRYEGQFILDDFKPFRHRDTGLEHPINEIGVLLAKGITISRYTRHRQGGENLMPGISHVLLTVARGSSNARAASLAANYLFERIGQPSANVNAFMVAGQQIPLSTQNDVTEALLKELELLDNRQGH